MRILYVTSNYPDELSPHAGIFIHRHASKLSQRGCRVDVLVPIPYAPPVTHSWRRMNRLAPFEVIDGIRIHRVRYPCPPGRWFLDFEGLSQCLFTVAAGAALHREYAYDVIHSHWFSTGGLIGRKLKAMLGRPHVGTERGCSIFQLQERSLFFQRLVKKAILSCDRPLAVSRTMADFLRQVCDGRVSCAALYNGCDTKMFFPDGELKSASSEPLFISVGLVHREKGIFELIEAFHGASAHGLEARLEIVGSGPDLAEARQRSAAGPGAGRILLSGPLKPELVAQQLRSADVLVSATRKEGLSNCVVEALCTGLPVLATDIPGMREAVLHEETGLLVPARDVGALATAMLRLSGDAALRKRLGRAALEHGRQNFDMDRSVEILLQLYSGLSPSN